MGHTLQPQMGKFYVLSGGFVKLHWKPSSAVGGTKACLLPVVCCPPGVLPSVACGVTGVRTDSPNARVESSHTPAVGDAFGIGDVIRHVSSTVDVRLINRRRKQHARAIVAGDCGAAAVQRTLHPGTPVNRAGRGFGTDPVIGSDAKVLNPPDGYEYTECERDSDDDVDEAMEAVVPWDHRGIAAAVADVLDGAVDADDELTPAVTPVRLKSPPGPGRATLVRKPSTRLAPSAANSLKPSGGSASPFSTPMLHATPSLSGSGASTNATRTRPVHPVPAAPSTPSAARPVAATVTTTVPLLLPEHRLAKDPDVVNIGPRIAEVLELPKALLVRLLLHRPKALRELEYYTASHMLMQSEVDTLWTLSPSLRRTVANFKLYGRLPPLGTAPPPTLAAPVSGTGRTGMEFVVPPSSVSAPTTVSPIALATLAASHHRSCPSPTVTPIPMVACTPVLRSPIALAASDSSEASRTGSRHGRGERFPTKEEML